MKIELTKEQFKTLMELVYMGNWLATSLHDEIPKRKQKYEEMERIIFKLAKENGLSQLVDAEEEEAFGCLPSRAFEDGPVRGYIDDYDDYTFWEELADRLAVRDMELIYGRDVAKQMSHEEYISKWSEFEDNYRTEFGRNGLTRVGLLR